ncbi:MAG: hypothetical protein EPO40_00560 [Myxococcaceae bacterium]|nr:MAG: hypothetical protein EPO40_00560 [Myxococcaceae bacterium]
MSNLQRAAALCLALASIGCDDEPFAGPSSPFAAEARPRNPDHFQLGNGWNLPTPFADVRSVAVSAGTSGMMGYEFQDWMRPAGEVDVRADGNGTRFRLALRGLVPGGLYTAWLVRVRGSSRGPKTNLALGRQFDGPAPASLVGTNGILVGADGAATHEVTLQPRYTDAAGTTYFGLDLWDEIHVAFHADRRAYGFAPGPNHWTQVVLPIRPRDGSAHGTVAAQSPPQYSVGNGVDGATTFAAMRDAAVAAGLSGAADYTEARWSSAAGRITINLVDFATQVNTNVVLTAEGLVPAAAYSAWLVSSSGATCPLGETRDGRAQPTRSLFASQLEVDAIGRGVMETTLSPTSQCGGGRTFGRLADWARVEVAFHADNTFHGAQMGPQHWVHLSAPLPAVP